jgi:hypothetical protein
MKRNLIPVLLCLAAVVAAFAQKADKRLAEPTAVLRTITAEQENNQYPGGAGRNVSRFIPVLRR